MKPASPAERVIGALDPALPLYAVLDGARDRRIAAMRRTDAPMWCLFRGDLPLELTAAAPHLLRLGRGHAFTEAFFSEGWQNAWGIVLASGAPSRDLRRHLRRFLRVRTEDGAILLFRYFDPRVLRVYLPTCTPSELDTFLGPIKAIAVEAEEPGAFHVHRRVGAGYEHVRIARGTNAIRTIGDLKSAGPISKEPPLRQPLVRIRDRQLRAFQERADAQFAEQMVKVLRKQFPAEVAALSDARIRERCRSALARASRYGLIGDDVLSFVTMTFTLSKQFDSHPSFQSVLSDPDVPGARKLSALYDQVQPADWAAARMMP